VVRTVDYVPFTETAVHAVLVDRVGGNFRHYRFTVLFITIGEYFSDCKITTPSKHALDKEVAENLWKMSEEWTGLYID